MWLTTIVAITNHIFFCIGIVRYDIAISELHSATENNTTKCKASSLSVDNYIILKKVGVYRCEETTVFYLDTNSYYRLWGDILFCLLYSSKVSAQ